MTKYCIKVKKPHMTDSFFFFINDMKYHVLPHRLTDYVYIYFLVSVNLIITIGVPWN